jgi:nucleoside-diphosphate-sugar epimerase
MGKSLFLAGASGAIGRRLAPLLVADGWRVTGTTRSSEKADLIRRLGAEPVVVDVFDAEALAKAVASVRPEVVIHQLTDLPPGLDPSKMPEAVVRNTRIREEGTRNLTAACLRTGAKRLIVQSIAFAYADGPTPHAEDDPLAASAGGVRSLESQTLAAPLEGVVLRYGRLYGPGTGFDGRHGVAPLHVDAAARAAEIAARGCEPGIYNIAENDGVVSSEKAKRLLKGWSADWRSPV